MEETAWHWEFTVVWGIIIYLIIGGLYFLYWDNKDRERWFFQLSVFLLLWWYVMLQDYKSYKIHKQWERERNDQS